VHFKLSHELTLFILVFEILHFNFQFDISSPFNLLSEEN
jgi:hypothetical protein